jgi:hypothetical protein
VPFLTTSFLFSPELLHQVLLYEDYVNESIHEDGKSLSNSLNFCAAR